MKFYHYLIPDDKAIRPEADWDNENSIAVFSEDWPWPLTHRTPQHGQTEIDEGQNWYDAVVKHCEMYHDLRILDKAPGHESFCVWDDEEKVWTGYAKLGGEWREFKWEEYGKDLTTT